MAETTTTSPGGAGGRSAFGAFAALTSALALFIAAISVVLVNSKDGGATKASSGSAQTVEVKLSEFAITPKVISVPAGAVKLSVTNGGAQIHNLEIPKLKKKTSDMAGGKTEVLDLGDVEEGTYEVLCNIPGHGDAGMTASLVVGGAAGASAGAASSSGGMMMAGMGTSGANPADQTIDFNATPAKDFQARDPKAPAPFSGTVHELTLETREAELEIAPGVKQTMWTFSLEGQAPTVPGPVLRGKLGDRFKVTLVNKGKVEHSVDFHASRVAWNDKMRSIKPGESLVYEFTADYAGIYMYHCGTPPVLHHIGTGMYGATIIDPPDLAKVDHEFFFVQSEFYTGAEGAPGDMDKMSKSAWDAVVFNGYVNQYQHAPIRVEPNQRIRVWVLDAGPSENSSFHVIGTIFDTVYKEGNYLLRPGSGQGGSQALDLQPAQGGFVEFSFDEAGLYPFVTHKFANPPIGALGVFQAGDVDPAAAAGH